MCRGHPSLHGPGSTIRKNRAMVRHERDEPLEPPSGSSERSRHRLCSLFLGSVINNWHRSITRQVIKQTQRERGGSHRRTACQ